MTIAHNENQSTFSFDTMEFPRRVDTLKILRDANHMRSEEIARLAKVFGRFIRRMVITPFVVAYRRQRMLEELSQLSDRVLDDIGVSRGNIAQIVDDAFAVYAEQKADTAKATLHSLAAKQGTQAAPTVSNDHKHQPLAA